MPNLVIAAPKSEEVFSTNGVIWGFDFISEKEVLLTIRDGKILRVNIENAKSEEIKHSLSIAVIGQGGLLDLTLDPDFAKNSFVYLTYSKKVGDMLATALARGKYLNGKLELLEDIFVANNLDSKGLHFGSRITFDDKGYLYLSVGERNVRDKAQDLKLHHGKILRLNSDGSIPKDNPFVGRKDADPAIFTVGHRNPQGIAFDKSTKTLWVSEHGPRGGDEINLLVAGRNYGWPIVSHGNEYWGPRISKEVSAKGFEDPVKTYVPSIAPSSLWIYQGDRFPEWKGNFFLGALVLRHLNRVKLDISSKRGLEEERLFQDKDRIRNVREGKDGYLYFSSDSGKLYRLINQK